MPCITVEEPTERGTDGALTIDFAKVHVDRISKKKFVLRNHGCMAATCLFDMTGSDDFRFSSRNASLTLQPGQKGDLSVTFVPKVVEKSEAGDGVCEAVIRVSVLNNQFDQYTLKLKGVSYACDAMLDVDYGLSSEEADDSALDAAMSYLNNQLTASEKGSMADVGGNAIGTISGAGIRDLLAMNNNGMKADGSTATSISRSQDHFILPELNLAELAVKQAMLPEDEVAPPMSSTYTMLLRSRVAHPLKFKLFTETEGAGASLTFAPSIGHLGGFSTREIMVTFSAKESVSLTKAIIGCTLQRILYKGLEDGNNNPLREGEGGPGSPSSSSFQQIDRSLQGAWDDTMKTLRVATDEDLAAIATYQSEKTTYDGKLAEQNAAIAKGKPPKVLLGPPPSLALQIGSKNAQGETTVYEILSEPIHEVASDTPEQKVTVTCNAVADFARFKCDGQGENISFRPTYMLQSTVHRFTFTNER